MLGTEAATDNQTILWQPQAGPQTSLLECPVFEVFYGGARGGGKTEGSIGDWLQHSSTYGEHAIGIFVRRRLKQLEEVIARTHQLFPKIGAKWNEQKKTWTMPGGGRLKFVYLERDQDAEEYQGHSYTRVYVEEITNFPVPGPVDKLRATLRSGVGVPTGMRLTGNPGGPGHNWVKKRYIDPAPQGFVIIEEEADVEFEGKTQTIRQARVFIPSKISDNRLLMINDPTYTLRLKQSGSAALVKAWLNGDWNIIDGAFFDTWDEDLHVLDANEFEKLKNSGMLFFRAFDWGSAKPFSVGWYAVLDREYTYRERVLPKGAMVKYREWYGASGVNKGLKMTADQVAQGIMIREVGERIRYGAADPSIFIRDGGPSIAETMTIHRCNWRRADNKRKTGWEQLRQRLTGSNGIPMLYFSDACEDTIRTLPILQHDDKDPEDLDTEAEDHAADETRYAVMSRPWLPRINSPQGLRLPKLPGQYTVNDLIERQTALRRAREDF